VLPSDASKFVADGRLDRRLFDVSYLLREGYDDAHQSAVPLIAAYGDTRRGREAVTAARRTRSLPALGGDALTVRKSGATRFWNALRADQTRSVGVRTHATGVRRLWLDGKVRATLDRSVPQIGAPAAWKAGHTGNGVTAAVLDTGYDKAHPDLKGVVKEAKDFTGSKGGVQDGNGHGTHVSSTVAGRGTASKGKYVGVAKGARLVEGKVLDDSGGGYDSWVLAGMEWAAKRAKVVNMSFGAGDTPEIDPLEEAVNRLTKQTGALFVVAAGNEGSDAQTVGSPGSADAAITVAAVDRKDGLATFSSRGPRIGDYAVKPDIAAPGVGIVAARAKGSELGTPVGTAYQRLDGTSMAAPHVAGAAAILAQRHPAWKAAELKAALMGTARSLPGTGPYATGTGRVDIARATGQQVHTTTPSISFGYLKWPNAEAKPVQKPLTYRNDTAAPVTLDLAVQATDEKGKPAPDGMFTTDQTQITVPAKGTATANITMTPAKGPVGLYGGHLTATTPDGKTTMQTALGGYKEPESYDLTVKLLDRDGKEPDASDEDALGAWNLYDLDTNQTEFLPRFVPSGETVRLRAGHYTVIGTVSTDRPGKPQAAYAQLARPDLALTKNTTVTLDTRTAKQVRIGVDRPTARFEEWSLNMLSNTPGDANIPYWTEFLDLPHDVDEVYAGSAGASPKFTFASLARFQEPQIRIDAEAPQAFPVQVWDANLAAGDSRPALLGTHRMGAVYGGSGTAKDLAKVQPKGKLVMLELAAKDDPAIPARVRNVKKAGGRAVLLVRGSGVPDLTETLDLPAMFTTLPEGRRLADLARKGATTVTYRGITVSPYQYHSLHISDKRVPEWPVYHDKAAEMGAVRATYRGLGGAWGASLNLGAEWRGRTFGYNWYERFPAPTTRTEYYPAGIRFSRNVGGDEFGFPEEYTPWRSYKPGEQATQTLMKGVMGPSFQADELPKPRPAWAYRKGDRMDVQIPVFSTTESGHYTLAEDAMPDRMSGSARLYRNGRLVKASNKPARGVFTLPAGTATYRLDVDATNHLPEWRLSKTVKSSWTFPSTHTDRTTPLPLMAVRYLPDLDTNNRAPAGKAFSFPVRVEHQPGSADTRPAALTVQASYDDGKTWHKVTLRPDGDQWTATVNNPAKGYVSLRAVAKDAAGNTVDQTILRGYGLTK
jgi:subtilisin family serine protease